MPAQHGGLKFKTSIVGACNIGIKQKEGASAISLNMDIARCHGREVASIKIVNLTKKVHRNIEVACAEMSYDGKVLSKSIFTISKKIQPQEIITLEDFDLKSINEKTSSIDCAVIGAEHF